MPSSSRKRRVLIATVTVGAGHVQAAKALEEAWKLSFPDDDVQFKDILEFTSPLHQKTYRDGYIKLVNHAPELFGRFFSRTDDPRIMKLILKPRRLLAEKSTKKFITYINQFQPDIVIGTHFLPLETMGAISYSKKLLHQPLIACVVTDFEAHALWLEPCIDLTFVATEHTKARLATRGVSPKHIHVTGIPVSPQFSQLKAQNDVRLKLGLVPHLSTLLVLGGGFGVGPIVNVMKALDHVETPLQVIAVAGRNESLKKKLETEKFRHPTQILGYANNMPELMMASDLILSKPGGLTSSEALAIGKPLLIFNPIPGQEMANSDYLLENGAASKINHIDDLPYKVNWLLDETRLAKMTANAKKLGHPQAAFAICDIISRHI